jgi:hypothetical protein
MWQDLLEVPENQNPPETSLLWAAKGISHPNAKSKAYFSEAGFFLFVGGLTSTILAHKTHTTTRHDDV